MVFGNAETTVATLVAITDGAIALCYDFWQNKNERGKTSGTPFVGKDYLLEPRGGEVGLSGRGNMRKREHPKKSFLQIQFVKTYC